jgi:hypothetical protein
VPWPLLQIAALTLYAAFAPVAALVCILLLEAAHPRRLASAYALGYVLALILAGVGGAALAGWAGPALASLASLVERFAAGRPGAGAGHHALSVALGLAMLAVGAWHWRRRDPRGATLPRWLGAVERIGLGRAFGLGVLLLLINPDNVLAFLAALHLTGETALGPAWAVPLTWLLVLCAAAPVVLPLGIYLVVPRQSAALLGALRDWIGRASQAAVDVVLAALGAWLILRGLSGLLG